MPRFTTLSAFASLALVAASTFAKPIDSFDDIKATGKPVTTINFTELVHRDKAVFGSPELGQPYSKLGLVLPSQIVDTSANMSPTETVGIKSTGISTVDNSNYQSLAFTTPQRIVAFKVRNERARAIIVTALDKTGNVLDQVVIDDARQAKFVGFMLDMPSITVVRVVSTHASIGDAIESPTYVTGVTFTLGDGEGPTDLADGPDVGDFGLATAVGNTGGMASALAMLGRGPAGFGAAGTGNAGNSSSRNPGNRNPNLPPAVIPEPTTILTVGILGSACFLRRRRGA